MPVKKILDLVPLILVKNEEYWLPYVLYSVLGRFNRYVIYDIGSQDRTKDIINAFINLQKDNAEIFYRPLPHCEPVVQGALRNSMIAEARNPWYILIDGDELYTEESLDALADEMENMKEMYISQGKTYGIVRRVEVFTDLKQAYGQDLALSHHRVYHRDMVFIGPHPGEAPLVPQKKNNEHWFSKNIVCYHMHNCLRSSLDKDVPKRLERRAQPTYHRGLLTPIDIFEKLPILKGKFEGFSRNPELEVLQKEL